MNADPVILRSGLHLSRGDTLEIGQDALVLKGQHFHHRTVRYENIADLEVGEYRGTDPQFPGVPEHMLLSFTFSAVPEFTSLQQRDPRVKDAYYLSDALFFDLARRDEVLAAAVIIEDRRKSNNPAIADCRYTFHDRSLRTIGK
jgi:hypothetical protein